MVSCNLLAFIAFTSSCFVTSRYKIISDPAGWLNVSKDKGVIRVKSLMDRESDFVRDSKYTALIGAYDNGKHDLLWYI